MLKILIDSPAWIGDLVMAQALFITLKERYPNAVIDVIASAWAEPLLQRMPEVHRVWVLSLPHGKFNLFARYRFAKSLRHENYDWAIVLRNSFKSALVPWIAKIRRRTGWLGESRYGILNDWRRLDKKKYPLMVQRFVSLAYEATHPMAADEGYPRPHLRVDDAMVRRTLVSLGLAEVGKRILALCPGAEYGPAKRWPAEHFATVARAKLGEGWSIWLLGSAKDQCITDQINLLCGGQCVNLAGRTDVGQVVDILSCADHVITNDSGLMHVAAALNRPIVALYGSSSPQFTPPLSDQVAIMSLHLACSPCFARVCQFGHTNCLVTLSPQRVLDHMLDTI